MTIPCIVYKVKVPGTKDYLYFYLYTSDLASINNVANIGWNNVAKLGYLQKIKTIHTRSMRTSYNSSLDLLRVGISFHTSSL